MLFVLFCAAIAQAQPFATACHGDERIAANKKAAFDSAAIGFFSTLISSDPASAYDQLAVDTQKNLTREQITGISKSVLQPIKVEHGEPERT